MRCCFVFLFLVSCAENNPGYVDQIKTTEKTAETSISLALRESAWICHHPETIYHGQPCTDPEPLFPDGCLVRDDDSKFCWKIAREDCQTIKADWQKNFCPLLEEID